MHRLIGCDPELFIKNMATGAFVSAHDLLPGTKQTPHAVNNGAIQVDGVSAEFNITPVDNPDDFSTRVFSVVNTLTSILRTINKDLKLVAEPTAYFDVKYFRKLPAMAKALGCTPDYNVWTGRQNIVKAPSSRRPFRTGAGHIHIGWTANRSANDEFHAKECLRVVRQLDAALFIPSLLWDNDNKRRELYGKMGSYRIKPYGVEYRPLSNAWVFEPGLHFFIVDTVLRAMKALDSSEFIYSEWDVAQRLKTISEDGHLDDLAVLEHYYTLYEKGYCSEMPDKWLSPSENKFLN